MKECPVITGYPLIYLDPRPVKGNHESVKPVSSTCSVACSAQPETHDCDTETDSRTQANVSANS